MLSSLLVVLFSCSAVVSRRVNGFDSESANCSSDEEFKYFKECPGEVTCRTRSSRISCPAVIQYSIPQCICKEGLYRGGLNDDGCYTDKQCDKLLCPGDNEFFECGGKCDNVCATLDKQNKTSCPESTFPYRCLQQCYCKDGYARDDEQKCIPIENCGTYV